MAKVYYDKDADLKFLKNKTVAVVGFGSQGRAQALNLKDSGVRVIAGLRKSGASWDVAKKDGLDVAEVSEASKVADVIHILTPDPVQPKVYREEIEPHLKPGNALSFSHGFNIHFGQIVPPKNVDVFMIAPKAPGPMVRQTFLEGAGTPSLLAVHQDFTKKAKQTALAFGKAIGGTRAGVIETSFREETETDLFGEQCVLCGGVSEMIVAGYETLVNAGYQPEMAYFECLHELKLIVDLVYQGGISHMRSKISETAQYGDFTRGSRIITEETRREMKKILHEIQNGEFAKEWILENQANRPVFNAFKKNAALHPIEDVGKKLRGMMSWLAGKKK